MVESYSLQIVMLTQDHELLPFWFRDAQVPRLLFELRWVSLGVCLAWCLLLQLVTTTVQGIERRPSWEELFAILAACVALRILFVAMRSTGVPIVGTVNHSDGCGDLLIIGLPRWCRYWSEATFFSWERGDLLLLHNQLVAHNASPGVGARQILPVFGDCFCSDLA